MSRPVNPNLKIRQNSTQFYFSCRSNGHTPMFCGRKVLDEELNRIEIERTAEKNLLTVTFTQDCSKNVEQALGLDSGTTIENLPNDIGLKNKTIKTVDDHFNDNRIISSTETTETDRKMKNTIFKMEPGGTLGFFVSPHPDMDGISHRTNHSANLSVTTPINRVSEAQTVTQPVFCTNKVFCEATINHQLT